MPKHLPTFKHLLHSSQQPQKAEPKEKSVNDLLSSSRSLRPRDVPPHLNGASSSNERIWSPSPIASTSGTSGLGGLVDVEQGGVHPAEILRRSNLAHRQASRGVAGPAPPPSWRPSASSTNTSISSSSDSYHSKALAQPVSTKQLISSAALLSNSPTTPKNTLVEHCLKTVLRYLEDDTPLYYSSHEEDEATGEIDQEENTYTLGEILREQIPYLSLHLKSSLLHTASLLPSDSPYRISDKSLLAILSDPPPDLDPSLVNGLDKIDISSDQSRDLESDWDVPGITEPVLSHLSLTLHPSPQSLLPRIPNLTSITSLNLGYCTLPSDLDRLVSALPAGLRELTLAGARFGGKGVTEEGMRRGFASMGRKLIVLKILDLSFLRLQLTSKLLEGLLIPGNTKLPSLRILGLRGVTNVDQGDRGYSNGAAMDGVPECASGDKVQNEDVGRVKKEVVDLLRNGGRGKYIEVIW
ncbi:hypothetical protein I302_103012 [Kwoniella bestiolae CBS 10118]|uniref:Uncharacterized protein n=1 Tax=Kwoniella bestiolae CBS 10118 TaxID=1296100 RepID=A0A1B9GGJ8_9TREE|nr:hypothetical protein I302_01708 [Kwoniella bestiolae CBS 10118]OCF30189.1 hypothetical protein I302_01708 [Kwoniella bestiolae CBS 10118]